jgi:hypothetical protein
MRRGDRLKLGIYYWQTRLIVPSTVNRIFSPFTALLNPHMNKFC